MRESQAALFVNEGQVADLFGPGRYRLGTQTLPVLMWLSLRSAGTPRLAVASVILALTVFACLTIIMLWYVRQLRKVAR